MGRTLVLPFPGQHLIPESSAGCCRAVVPRSFYIAEFLCKEPQSVGRGASVL